jgi:hypothetical protein
MTLYDMMRESGVAVWSYTKQAFIEFVPCPGEKRVRIDVHEDLENYAVYRVRYGEDRMVYPLSQRPLDWRIDYT